MTENEFLLNDRITKIKSVVSNYGINNFYISFSGGLDSCVLSALVDLAIPNNNIPRVYVNTGIEYNSIFSFVKKLQESDHVWDLIIIKPLQNIKKVLTEYGYPFKSKNHSAVWRSYNQSGFNLWVTKYVNGLYKWSGQKCPQKLKYQFTPEFTKFKISDICCSKLKEEPLKNWEVENNKPYSMIGITRDEGGRRESAKCLSFKKEELRHFQPLVAVSKEWEKWFIETYNIELCELYKEPFCFDRTGCKGCPFALNLQHELDILEKYFPSERNQCEYIWGPVYNEYRRLKYRLKGEIQND